MHEQTHTNSQARPRRRLSVEERALGDKRVGAFMGTVYAWMTAGLATSAYVAHWLSGQPELLASWFDGGATTWFLLLTPFALIFVLGARVKKAHPVESTFWFLLMTSIMGTWLTGIAVQATEDPAFATAVWETLGVTVAMFGGMSLTGWITRKDLSAMGNFFVAALWGLIAMGFVNIYFVQSAAVDLLYHVAGVVIFAGLTAYDTQKIKNYYYENGAHHGLAVWGALTLYLDFVNLFLHLLRFFGMGSSDD
jgi:FtsH-binding integral membrane protein